MTTKHALLSGAVVFVAGCASGLRLYADDVPHGALRVGEVISLASKQDLNRLEHTRKALLASGIPEKSLGDGSLAAIRATCCGDQSEAGSNLFVYVPRQLKVHSGDILVIESGRPSHGSSSGSPNKAVRVVQKRDSENVQCRWTSPTLAERVRHLNQQADILYCDWMSEQGWQAPTKRYPVWFKPGPT